MNEVKLITAVASEILSREDVVKPYIKVDHADEDDLIDALISSAREQIELWCGLSIGAQTRQWIIDLDEEREIPFGPVDEISAVAMKGSDGYEAKVIDDDYEVESDAIFQTFTPYCEGRWKLTYTTGYTSDTLPPALKGIWLQLVAYLYEHRGNEGVDIPVQIKKALNPFKRSLI